MDSANNRAHSILPAVAELIQKQRYREALDHIKRKLKKTPQDTSLLALRAELLLKAGDVAGAESQCRELLLRKPPITNIDTVQAIFEALSELFIHRDSNVKQAEVSKIWQDAIAAQTSSAAKAQFAKEWAEAALEVGQWGQLAQAAGATQRFLSSTDGDRRTYFYWQQLANWLDCMVGQADPRMIEIVLRSLEAAYRNIPEVQNGANEPGGTWISSKNEFALLREIFIESKNHKRLLALLDSRKSADEIDSAKSTEGSSAIDSTWGIPETKLECLWQLCQIEEESSHAAEDPRRCRDLAMSIIRDAQNSGPQWKADKLDFMEKVVHCQAILGFPIDAEEKILELIDKKPETRTSTLSRVYYWHRKFQKDRSEQSSLKLLDALQLFLAKNITKPTCCEDIRNAVIDLPDAQYAKLKEYVDSLIQMDGLPLSFAAVSEADQLRLVNHSLIMQLETQKSISGVVAKNLEETVLTATKLHKELRENMKDIPETARHPGDEALLMASDTTLIIGLLQDPQISLMQAIVMLSHLVSQAEHNYDARLKLLPLLQQGGMFSLAAAQFKGLDVKSVLNESNALRLFFRISTRAPFRDAKGQDMMTDMNKVLLWYAQAVQQASDARVKAINNSNYKQTAQITIEAERLRHSATRQTLLLECRRITRLTGLSINEAALGLGRTPLKGHIAGQVNDKSYRDRNKDLVIDGPNPTLVWLRCMKQIDAIFEVAARPLAQTVGIKQSNSGRLMLDPVLDEIQAALRNKHVFLSEAETETLEFALCLHHVALSLTLDGEPDIEPLREWLIPCFDMRKTQFTDLKELLRKTEEVVKQDNRLPPAGLVQWIFLHLDADIVLYKLLNKLIAFVDERLKKMPAGERNALKGAAKEEQKQIHARRDAIRKAIHAIQNNLRKVQESGKLHKDVLGTGMEKDKVSSVQQAIEELIGQAQASKIVNQLIASVMDGLDGILKVPRPT